VLAISRRSLMGVDLKMKGMDFIPGYYDININIEVREKNPVLTMPALAEMVLNKVFSM
jgi:hypothetical protein